MSSPARPVVLVLQGSPRRRGATARLTAAFLEPLAPARLCTRFLFSKNLLPCRGCDRCRRQTCPLRDDVPGLLNDLARADALVLAAPVYFYGFPAHVKALIDRCQPLWHHPPSRRGRPAFLIATSGSEDPKNFTALSLQANAFFNTTGFTRKGQLLVPATEGPGAAGRLQAAQAEARALGRQWLARGDNP